MTPSDLRSTLELLARNHRWTWQHRVVSLFRRLPTAAPERHPIGAVAALDEAQLAALAADESFVSAVGAEAAALHAELATAVTAPDVVYYSPEFGITELVPQYSGGLGILAGDHLKAASDIGTSLGAVGLFYRQGFFRQQIGADGQHERYEEYDAADLGLTDTGIVVDVPMADRTVRATVWRLDVGRVPLLLLDADRPDNDERDRGITDRLYSGDRQHRLEQEMLLGVGGARAVAAMGWRPGVHHLNEGHAGFLGLELIDRAIAAGAGGPALAVDAVRPHVLFTTHTPVPAGIDRFDRDLIGPYLAPWARAWFVDIDELMGLGEDPDAGRSVFNMAALCLRLASRANGVSKLHGEVSRHLFARVPNGGAITSITNGVHARTWVNPPLQDLFDRELGEGWDRGDPRAWARAVHIGSDALVANRAETRGPLADLLAERMGAKLAPDALVVGFARRFATYKRATLLLRRPDLLAALLGDDDRPVHIVFAGKAHPADGPGKALLARVLEHGADPAANGRFSFVPDYDIAVARALYAGCDVWLNTPVRPHEASGTSGEKAALNGAINCSILDGWWAEMSDGRNGFDIRTFDGSRVTAAADDLDDDARDDAEATNALEVLAAIAAEFHADGVGAPSSAWLDRVRYSWASLGPQVTAARMVGDYDRLLYGPMLATQRRAGV